MYRHVAPKSQLPQFQVRHRPFIEEAYRLFIENQYGLLQSVIARVSILDIQYFAKKYGRRIVYHAFGSDTLAPLCFLKNTLPDKLLTDLIKNNNFAPLRSFFMYQKCIERSHLYNKAKKKHLREKVSFFILTMPTEMFEFWQKNKSNKRLVTAEMHNNVITIARVIRQSVQIEDKLVLLSEKEREDSEVFDTANALLTLLKQLYFLEGNEDATKRVQSVLVHLESSKELLILKGLSERLKGITLKASRSAYNLR